MHTSPSTQSTHTHNSIRNYILRYSFEIDVRLSATQLCLSDCNLIISITALAFKYTRTQTNAVFVFFFFFCFNLCLALALTHLHHQLLLSTESEKKKRRAFFSLLFALLTIDECILLFAMDMQLRLVVLRFIDRQLTHSFYLLFTVLFTHNHFVIIRSTNKRDQNEHQNWNNIKRNWERCVHKHRSSNSSKTIFFAICIIIMWRTGASMDVDHNNKTFLNIIKRERTKIKHD